MALRWGTSILLEGSLSHAGLGIGFILFDLPVNLSAGFVFDEEQLWISSVVEGTLPIW